MLGLCSNYYTDWGMISLLSSLMHAQVSGDGVLGGFTGKPSKFIIHTKKPNLYHDRLLEVTVVTRSPKSDLPSAESSSAVVTTNVHDNEDGTYLVEYTPHQAGDHTVTVQYQKQHIVGSPYRASIIETTDASKCRLSVAGTKDSEHGVTPLKFVTSDILNLTVDTTNAGAGMLRAEARHMESGDSLANALILLHDGGLYGVRLKLEKAGTYTVAVKWSGDNVPGSPMSITVSEKLTANMITVRGFSYSFLHALHIVPNVALEWWIQCPVVSNDLTARPCN